MLWADVTLLVGAVFLLGYWLGSTKREKGERDGDRKK